MDNTASTGIDHLFCRLRPRLGELSPRRGSPGCPWVSVQPLWKLFAFIFSASKSEIMGMQN